MEQKACNTGVQRNPQKQDKLKNCKLQFITHCNQQYSYTDSARVALEGGCRWVQLRMKGADSGTLLATALQVQSLCAGYNATFIINDNVSLAKQIGADGVHLGKEDMPVAQARKILGDGFIIGATVNSIPDIESHLGDDTPDYFGCGPFRFTTTKENLAPIVGMEGYREILHYMKENNISIPIVAIGGIEKDDITELMECGIDGIALSGCILGASNPAAMMAEIADIIHKNVYKPLK